MLECVVTQVSSGDMMALQLRPLGSTASTTSWSLVSAPPGLGVGVGTVCLRWLQGLLRFLVAIPVPKARNQGRQWQWPKLVVCTHSVAGVSCRCLCGGRHLLLTQTQWCGLEQAAQVGANCGHICSCRHPGCPHVLPGLAVAPSSRGQCGGAGPGYSPERRLDSGSPPCASRREFVRAQPQRPACLSARFRAPEGQANRHGLRQLLSVNMNSCGAKASKIRRGPWQLCWPLVPSSVVTPLDLSVEFPVNDDPSAGWLLQVVLAFLSVFPSL